MIKKIKTLGLILALAISCSDNQDFDKILWSSDSIHSDNIRAKMLDDLLKNVLEFPILKNEKGSKRTEVLNLLGEPDEYDCNGFDTYLIEEKQGWVDPKGFIKLKLMYENNETLVGYIVEEANYQE